MTTSAEVPAIPGARRPAVSDRSSSAEESPAVSQQRADCIADSAGGLTFDIAHDGRPGAAESWDTALVLRRRGGQDRSDELRLPLVPAADGRLRATLPSTVTLPEGRWDAYWQAADGSSARLMPGVLDLRSLVDRRPDSDRPSVAVRIPYATKHGNLSVRGWLRAPHAEAGEILVADGAVTVQGRCFGTEPGPGAVVEARCRHRPSLVHTVPAERQGPGFGFGFTVSYKELAESWEGGSDAWDLWLRPDPGAEAVRIARILDDVADKKHIFSYPSQALAAPHGPAEAGLYYTADNDLAVRISEGGGKTD